MSSRPSPSKRARIDDSTVTQLPPPRATAKIIHISSTSPVKRAAVTTPSKARRVVHTRNGTATPTTTRKKQLQGTSKADAAASSSKAVPKRPRASLSRVAAERNNEEGVDSEDEHLENSSEEEEEEEDDDTHSEREPASPTKRKSRAIELATLPEESAIRRTSSDVYFQLTSRPSKTSDNVFSALLPRITPEECTELIHQSPVQQKHASRIAQLRKRNQDELPAYAVEMEQGFNLLFYGYGSKRSLLNHYATTICAKRGPVVVVNGFFPSIGIQDILENIESLPVLSSLPPPIQPGVEGRAQRIYDFFLPHNVRPQAKTSKRPLHLIIHNIDSPSLRNSRTKSCLALLASNLRIHLVASVDHINAGLIWTTSEMLGRKHEYEGKPDIREAVPSSRGFAWMWHEATTFEPYEIELSFRDLSVLPKTTSAAAARAEDMSGPTAVVNEAAAKQVLASVTQKAKRLFNLLGQQQLAAWGEHPDLSIGDDDIHVLGMARDLLSLKAREDFIATNDVALRGLLQEFRDHRMVVSGAGPDQDGKSAGEVLWIPLEKQVLVQALEGLGI